MPRSRSSGGLVVVGDPDDNRATSLDAALARAGRPTPTRIPWLVAVREPALLASMGSAGDVLRIESPGSNRETWHELARRGGFVGAVEHAEWRPGRAWFRGLNGALRAIEAAAPHLISSHPAEHVLAMTDKAECHTRLLAAGVSVPESFPAPASASLLDDLLAARGVSAAFVKPRWGSSGAGVLAYRRSGDQRRLITTAVLEGGRIWNNKRLRTYANAAAITRLLDAVLGDGAVVERWNPKATTAGGPFDSLRVLVVDGRIAQRVARVGRGTVTNLHLDSARLDADTALAPWGVSAGRAVNDACLRTAACFPRQVMVAVDVMIDMRGRAYVLECNAWGDYLPGLLVDGADSYDVQVRALDRRGRAA